MALFKKQPEPVFQSGDEEALLALVHTLRPDGRFATRQLLNPAGGVIVVEVVNLAPRQGNMTARWRDAGDLAEKLRERGWGAHVSRNASGNPWCDISVAPRK